MTGLGRRSRSCPSMSTCLLPARSASSCWLSSIAETLIADMTATISCDNARAGTRRQRLLVTSGAQLGGGHFHSSSWPAWSRIWTLAPVRAARSSAGDRPAGARLSWQSHAAAAAAAIALVSSACCRAARAETSAAAANAAVSPARRAAAPSGSETNASASRGQGAVSHRGPGPAGTRGPARSARSGDCRGPRPCRAGSSRANQRSAAAPGTHSPVPG